MVVTKWKRAYLRFTHGADRRARGAAGRHKLKSAVRMVEEVNAIAQVVVSEVWRTSLDV
jgi:hypothetical protein